MRKLLFLLCLLLATPCWGGSQVYSSGGVDQSAVAVTGGTISGTTITNSPISGSTGTFTVLKANTSYSVPYILCQSAVAVSLSGTTTETTLATCPIPANAMGLNGALRFTVQQAFTNSANTKNFYTYLGSTLFHTTSGTTTASNSVLYLIRNRNNAASQIGMYPWGQGFPGSFSTAAVTGTVDTSVAVNLTIKGKTSLEAAVTASISGTGGVCTATVASGAYAAGRYIYVPTGTGSCTSGTVAVGSATVSTVPVLTSNGTTTYTYACDCEGGPVTSVAAQVFSVATLEGYTIELLPGAN